MVKPKEPGRRVETAEAPSVQLIFSEVLCRMSFLAAPEAEALAHALLTLCRCRLGYLDGGLVHGRHARVSLGGSAARNAATGPERPGLDSLNARRVCHDRLKVVVSSDAQWFPDRSLQHLDLLVDCFPTPSCLGYPSRCSGLFFRSSQRL